MELASETAYESIPSDVTLLSLPLSTSGLQQLTNLYPRVATEWRALVHAQIRVQFSYGVRTSNNGSKLFEGERGLY